MLLETHLPITQVAQGAGYASLRRFNTAVAAAWGRPPRELRRSTVSTGEATDAIVLRLPWRAPFDFAQLLAFHARRVIPGVEAVTQLGYRRSIIVDGEPGWFEVRAVAREPALALHLHHPRTQALGTIAVRVRRMFDLDADPRELRTAFAGDGLLGPLIKRWPGQRLPGAWDGFELAVRAVLGQQVSVAAARTLAARVAAAYGQPNPANAPADVAVLFPTAAQLAQAPLEAQGLTRARAATIRSLAQAVVEGRVAFRPEQTLGDFVDSLVALPGIGAWTAHYIAMRALSQPDAFPAADLILRRVAGAGLTLTTRELETLSERWRPWRAYAVMLLWRAS